MISSASTRMKPGSTLVRDPVEVLGLQGRALALERLLDKRGEIGDELPAPAGLHLDEQRLALVHAHAAREADRLTAPRFAGGPAHRAHDRFREGPP